MAEILFHAHSGLRYLVLLAGAAAVLWSLARLLARRGYGRAARALAIAFTALLDLQVLLGLATLLARGFYPALAGHIFLMLLAAVAAHATSILARRRSSGPPYAPHAVALVGYALTLGVIVAGILAIGRSVV